MNSQKRGIAKEIVATLVKLTNGDCARIINVRPPVLLMQLADRDQDDIMDAYSHEGFLIHVLSSEILYVCLSEELVPRPMPPALLEEVEAHRRAAIVQNHNLELLKTRHKTAIRASAQAT